MCFNFSLIFSSIREVEYNLRPVCQAFEVYIGKVISKFQGVENCVVDIQNKRIVVTGDFDQKKLFEKLQKMRREIIKKDDELIEKYQSIHAQVRSEDEKKMAKFDMSKVDNLRGALFILLLLPFFYFFLCLNYINQKN
ncbi:hypothetical protein Bca101_021474 [Brassica carinata]